METFKKEKEKGRKKAAKIMMRLCLIHIWVLFEGDIQLDLLRPRIGTEINKGKT